MEKDQMQERIELLVQQVNLLRKQRADLSRRLTQLQEQQSAPLDGRFPLSELSRMTDGIVHDMRNGMGIIRNIVGFMRDDPAATAQVNDLLKISRSLDFCEVVLRNLSAIGGQDLLDPEDVNLEKIAREMFSMLEYKLVDVELVIEDDENEPVILADEGHMKQVFMNLIKNAGEAMPNGGTLTCRFRREADMMRVEMQDSGPGITEENQKHLFKKFFTTKERGYGLGLYIVHTIVERHGGTISVQSTLGKGTTFTMLIPIEVELDE